ncbi:MAG: hypothetical protein LBC40_09015 [Dysgonamonadaceae bacterium]|jgi:hypothetical protein|nr:hypothetical protein [Dysgonamonadaceae bacterium]
MKKILFILIFIVALATSCEPLQFDDPSTFTLDEAIEITPDYYFKITSSAFHSALFWSFDALLSTSGFALLGDQMTTHNTSYGWLDLNREPRTSLNTSDSYMGYSVLAGPYSDFYQANLDATKVIAGLDKGNPGIDDKGVNRTDEVYAVAHLTKGISQGFLGAIYDRGLIVDEDLGAAIEPDFPHSYKELIENAVAHLDKAISYAGKASSITLDDFATNAVADKDVFIKYANSLAARFLASIPRDREEARVLGNDFWNRVLRYAQAGITEDFTTAPLTVYSSTVFYNYSTSYLSFTVSGVPYLPVDTKLAYFADATGTYPAEYPTDNTVLGPVETNDARFYQYFRYYAAFGGYVNPDYGRQMFSNYGRIRWGDGYNDALYNKRQVVMLAEEVRLLRAEAKFWTGDLAGAAAELNAPNADRIALGGLPPVPATEAALEYVMHYEWAISIDIAGGNVGPFAYQRRHNLLQPGTPTQFPITQDQLNLTSIKPYTFGGVDHAGEKGVWGETGTAGNDWGWKGTKVLY